MKPTIKSLSAVMLFSILALTSCNKTEKHSGHDFNGAYYGENLNRIAFPIGGIGAGMVCLEGNGCISHVSIRHRPQVFNEPFMFSAISVKGIENGAKVLEGPIQKWKKFGSPGTGNGAGNSSYGFPRFSEAAFSAKFPFATVSLRDKDIPLEVSIKGWSPFVPTDADNSSLPVGALEYTFKNTSGKDQEIVFSYNASNFMRVAMGNLPAEGDNRIIPRENGFILWQDARISGFNQDAYINSDFYSYTGSGKRVKGLKAMYYDNPDLEGEPKVVRIDKKVNLEWMHKFDIPGIPATEMSARWTGFIKVNKSGEYKFAVSGDDGYRLFIDNELIIENWRDHGEVAMVKPMALKAGKEYPVKLEYYQNAGGAAIRLGYDVFDPENEEYSAEGGFAVFTDEPGAVVDPCWFRGGWFDARTILWKDIKEGNTPSGDPADDAPGASLFVPFKLKKGEAKTIKLKLAWYVPHSDLRTGASPCDNKKKCSTEKKGCAKPSSKYYEPWYAGEFKDINSLIKYWQTKYDELHAKTKLFTETFYNSDLPDLVLEAVAANLTILKSPTVLRQKDGRLWAFEGCSDDVGCCPGSCTHVWNYAQAIPWLFPSLERTLRESEFNVSQDSTGHQTFRTPLPIRPPYHSFYAAADGQLGGIMKVYREWRISGDDQWLEKLWPKIKQSYKFCSDTWDPKKKGILEEPHHNTYDIEFWGPNGMLTSFYLGATKAMINMGKAMDEDVSQYQTLLDKGKKYMESELWNGEYFIQKIQWKGLEADDPTEQTKGFNLNYSEEAMKILEEEGPKYQYGNGCLSDGILGCWIASMCGLDEYINPDKMKSHLVAVHQYNLKKDLTDHANPQRPSFALGKDGGLLLCTWPKGNALSLPFVYSNEVWTGIEYQVAAHLMEMGEVDKGLDVVREVRKRYDGRIRNPFNEYECGNWYARALASYGMIKGLTGLFYDAVDQVMYIDSQIGDDFKCFFSCETGFGLAGLKNGEPFTETVYGSIPVKKYVVAGRKSE